MSHQTSDSLRQRLHSLRASRHSAEGTSTSNVFSLLASGFFFCVIRLFNRLRSVRK
jgi:hypothetical protein